MPCGMRSNCASGKQTSARACRVALVLSLFCMSGIRAQAPAARVDGSVRDSSSGLPLIGARVELRNDASRLTGSTDQQGYFALGRVPAGQYRVDIRRVGYAVAERDLRVGDRDTSLTFALVAIARGLDTVRVRATLTAISGLVGRAADLRPLRGVVIQVIGANQRATTDSAGRFLIPLSKGDRYFVRIHDRAFSEQAIALDVAEGSVAQTSALLDSVIGVRQDVPDSWIREFDERVRWQGSGGAVVPGSELQRYAGGSVTDAVQASPSFMKRGLRIDPNACVFIDGVPKPGFNLDAIPVEHIAAIELYTNRGDVTGTLGTLWPRGAPCGTALTTRRSADVQSTIRLVSIWLKR